jgi:phosphoglycerate dehydrogenase-like enzyme
MFIVLPSWDMPKLTGSIMTTLKKCTSYFKIVQSRDDYMKIQSSEKYSFDVLAVWGLPGFSKELVADQMANSRSFKWLHSLSVGCDEYCSVQSFRESAIPCTNARGAFSAVLAEYVLLGMLYHAKKVESFQSKKQGQKWQVEPVELVANQTLAVIGYGDIGSGVAKMAKNAFGMRTIGVNKFPKFVTKAQAEWVDEVVGLEEYDRVLAEADYVVGTLPKMVQTNDFFNSKNTFSKMKKSAVFMNIGRGTTVDEDDLASALHGGQIAGAALDVFKAEPLARTNRLWYAPNLFMTPHCADQDSGWLFRSMKIFGGNLEKWCAGKKLDNIIDK